MVTGGHVAGSYWTITTCYTEWIRARCVLRLYASDQYVLRQRTAYHIEILVRIRKIQFLEHLCSKKFGEWLQVIRDYPRTTSYFPAYEYIMDDLRYFNDKVTFMRDHYMVKNSLSRDCLVSFPLVSCHYLK